MARRRPGDRAFVCGCGRCSYCRSGNAQVCPDQQQPRFTHWGSFAELVALLPVFDRASPAGMTMIDPLHG